jgi:4a-hydroxytetrahydrobiopterin dehydratase
MARPDLLSPEFISEALANLPLWQKEDKSIVRHISAANFVAAVGIINAIAILAEQLDHHPDVLLFGWNKLKITLSTHDQGGLTELDFKLAKKIEDLGF